MAFSDPRRDEVWSRYRARNFPSTLDEAEQERCLHLRAARLHQGEGGGLTLAACMERVDQLAEQAMAHDGERDQVFLEALLDCAQCIVPEVP